MNKNCIYVNYGFTYKVNYKEEVMLWKLRTKQIRIEVVALLQHRPARR